MTCKKRKLKYIREKNYYRSFGEGKIFITVSNELDRESVFKAKEKLLNNAELELEKMEKKYKMPFGINAVIGGLNGDDLIRDCTSFGFLFKRTLK